MKNFWWGWIFWGGLKHVLVCSRIEQVEVTAFSDDAIDQHPVELDVALAEVFVVACKLVVFVFRVELPPFGELLHHIVKEADIKASFLCLMVGFFVLVGILDTVHGLKH